MIPYLLITLLAAYVSFVSFILFTICFLKAGEPDEFPTDQTKTINNH